VYTKLCTQFFQRFSRGLNPACLYVFKADPDCSDDLQLFEAVKHFLVAGSVLYDEFSAAIDGENERGAGFAELADIFFGIPLEFCDGADFAQIDHNKHLDMEKA
jgi:hypothetical protein